MQCNYNAHQASPGLNWTVYFTVSCHFLDSFWIFHWYSLDHQDCYNTHTLSEFSEEEDFKAKTKFIVMTVASDWQLSLYRPGPGIILSEAEERRETIFPPQPTQVEPGTNFSHHSPSLSEAVFLVDFNHNTSSVFSLKFKLLSIHLVMHLWLSLRLNIPKNFDSIKLFSLVWNKVDITQTLKMTELYFSPGWARHATARRCWLRLLGEREVGSWHFMIPMILLPPALVNQHWMCRLFTTFCSGKYWRRHDTAIESTYPVLTM